MKCTRIVLEPKGEEVEYDEWFEKYLWGKFIEYLPSLEVEFVWNFGAAGSDELTIAVRSEDMECFSANSMLGMFPMSQMLAQFEDHLLTFDEDLEEWAVQLDQCSAQCVSIAKRFRERENLPL